MGALLPLSTKISEGIWQVNVEETYADLECIECGHDTYVQFGESTDFMEDLPVFEDEWYPIFRKRLSTYPCAGKQCVEEAERDYAARRSAALQRY